MDPLIVYGSLRVSFLSGQFYLIVEYLLIGCMLLLLMKMMMMILMVVN